jgi:hypothetical protein
MRSAFVSVVCVLACCSVALADGDGPSRKLTATEAAAYAAVRAGIQAALPKAPAEYKLAFECDGGCEDFEVPVALAGGAAARMRFSATYTHDEATRDAQMQSAFTGMAKGTPEQQAKLAELDTKEAALRKARDQSRDRAEKDKIRAEMKAVQAEANEIRDGIMAAYQTRLAGGGAAALSQEVVASLPVKEIAIRVLVNQDASLLDEAPPIQVAGATFAFEQADGCQNSDTRCISIFLGPFRKVKKVSSYTQYVLPDRDLGACTKARGIEIIVTGPKDKPEVVREFAGKIDVAKLKALLP